MKIKGKVFKSGGSYAVRISKLWIESGIVKDGEEIEVELPISKNAVMRTYTLDQNIMRHYQMEDSRFINSNSFIEIV